MILTTDCWKMSGGRFAVGQKYNNTCLTTCGQGISWQAMSFTKDQILILVHNSVENDKYVTGKLQVNNGTFVINNFTWINLLVSGINN